VKKEVLDHGYIELIESWGSDERIIEAARMSTAKGFQGWGGSEPCPQCKDAGRLDSHDGLFVDGNAAMAARVACKCSGSGKTIGDEKLLAFLWKNNHATPFEMAGAIIEVQAPIFVFREWHRHRTQSYNELSARYTPLPDVNYIPTLDRLMLDAGKNKQAGGTGAVLTLTAAQSFIDNLPDVHARLQDTYETALANGVPKELARIILPVGRYSRMRASANLRNWLAFLTLRQAPNAQWEIRQYANALHDMLAQKFPRTLVLFDEGKKS
jgi:thymidylate synthase (FAD)